MDTVGILCAMDAAHNEPQITIRRIYSNIINMAHDSNLNIEYEITINVERYEVKLICDIVYRLLRTVP